MLKECLVTCIKNMSYKEGERNYQKDIENRDKLSKILYNTI